MSDETQLNILPNRTPRGSESREKKMRAVYVPPSSLPDPDPVPGYQFRWIATSVLGVTDPANVSRKMREGWEPVAAKDHPELNLLGNANGNVELGGLMLCKMPVENVLARATYYNGQAQAQMDSVDNHFMRNNDPRMPLFSEKSSSTTRGSRFGSGSK